MPFRRRSVLALPGLAIFAAVLIIPTVNAHAEANAAFSLLNGSWSGSGQMRLEGGRTENLRCRASYTDRNNGSSLGISLRCASASSKVDLRANLKASAGTRVSGQWEEREFSTGGNASGTASGNHVSLAISGDLLTGSMSVTTNGARQSVSITTHNVSLKGIQIALARD